MSTTHVTRRSRRPGDAGSALVEMTFLAPMLLVLLVGIVEVARFANLAIMVGNAAHAGAQYGAHSVISAADTSGMQNAALNDGQNITGLTATAGHSCQCADGSASTCLPTDCANSHRLVFVTVDTAGSFSSLVHFPGLPQSFAVNGHAVMRVAQ